MIFESFNEYSINEGVYDKGIFKAILLGGGPGSGKSYVAETLTFADKLNNKFPMSALGLKFVNSDIAFEHGLEMANISFDLDSLKKDDPTEYKRAMDIRQRAKSITNTQFDLYINGRLGLVIDGTGRKFDKIKDTGDNLESLGYDKLMIFVNTSLDVALERNAKRKRKVSEDEAILMWKQVQDNIGKFQKYFGRDNFIVVDNNVYASDEYLMDINKEIRNFLNKPIENDIAVKWIQNELNLKRK